ncbi:MAG: TrmH family RNA methyltransferase [Candidatus Saccharimonadales bacterium]|jgi:23S rRNA (guanosine2251-2'-O)-methyltransferase
MRQIVLIAHDIRSTHNVGALLRTADCLGVDTVYFSGYTPYPTRDSGPDTRLPHIARKLDMQIHKTALGAEKSVSWQCHPDAFILLQTLRDQGYCIAALEQHPDSLDISSWRPPDKIALLLGREVEGVDPDLLSMCDVVVEIPQFGTKESLNVVQAAAISLYQMRFATLV